MERQQQYDVLLRSWGFIVGLYLIVSTLMYAGLLDHYTHREQTNVSEFKFTIFLEDNDPVSKVMVAPDNQLEANLQRSKKVWLSKPPHGQKWKHRVPKCLIIGVQKGGTGALLEFLNLHPDIVINHEETHFFDFKDRYGLGYLYYRRQMPVSLPSQIGIEKTPAYFYIDEVPERVRAMNSSIKLILTVRNPVTRLISQYAMLRKEANGDYPQIQSVLFNQKGTINLNFSGFDISTYHKHFSRWLKYFPRNQIHIVDGDRFVTDPYPELYRVEDFLGLHHGIVREKIYFDTDKGFYCMITDYDGPQCLDKTKGLKHPDLSEGELTRIKKYFEPLNQLFFKVANQTFDWN